MFYSFLNEEKLTLACIQNEKTEKSSLTFINSVWESVPLIDYGSMSSSWLKDFMLEGIGSEIRKASSLGNETPAEATAGQGRLVQILGRGQERLDRAGTRSTRSSQGSDWWNLKHRGKSPNLAKHTNAWISVSDGSHSARLYLTVEALKEIFDWDNQNSNEDNLFVRDGCILLKTYSFDYCVGNENSKDNNAKDKEIPSVHFKVSSLEPKPGFNDHANHNGNSGERLLRPVMEETDVLYGLQCLARQKQEPISATNIARDWDIAFGRLSKGRLTSTTTDEEARALVDGENGLEAILELAEQAASKDEAIQEWELAKKEFGVVDADGTNNDETLHNVQKPIATRRKNGNGGVQEHDSQEEEDLSHMYIQNVLATSDDEGESESENEKPELFETQPKAMMTSTESVRANLEEKESGKMIVGSRARMRRKRPRANSFESASNLTLDEAFSGPANARKSPNQTRRRQEQRFMRQQQQDKSQKNSGIWESVKEQLFEPGRTLLYCVPSSRLPSVAQSKDDENMFVTPKRALISSTGSAKNLGSGASVGTNLTSWTPNPSSGAYYRKYGLARWLSHNTTDEA